jgi:hypothetical protein
VVTYNRKLREAAAAADGETVAADAPVPQQRRVKRHKTGTGRDTALSAAVASVEMAGAAWKNWKFGDRSWQAEAWRLYDITGQLRFVANWVGNSVSRCRLYVAEVDENGEATHEVKDNPEVAALAAGPLGRGPAKDEALRLLGINIFVPGECYIIAEADGIASGVDRWFVVSGAQIKKTGSDITVTRSQLQGGGVMKYRDGTDLILRCWTPHPRNTDEPDSPTRSALPDLRELEAIRKREFAELDSRLAGAGLLAVPEGIDFPRNPTDPTGPSGLMAVLQRAMAASLADRATAEAMVPIAFTAPAEAIDKIRHITFWSELSAQLLPLKESAIRSLAQDLDIPPEVMLGLGNSNHWSAWQISEEAVSTQIVPVLSRIADALTQGYLKAALEEMGLDPERYVYEFDTAPLTTRPNRSADAITYWDKLLISDQAALEAGAFNDGDIPVAEERLRRMMEMAVVQNPTLLAIPEVQAVLGVSIPIPISKVGEGQGEITSGDDTAPPDDETPPEQTPQTEESAASALFPVANMAVRRALALAGGRLFSHRERDRYPGVAKHALHVRYPDTITPGRAETLLAGAWDEVYAIADDLLVDAGELRNILHGFTIELLTRRMAYDPALLRDCLRAFDRYGRRPAAVGG